MLVIMPCDYICDLRRLLYKWYNEAIDRIEYHKEIVLWNVGLLLYKENSGGRVQWKEYYYYWSKIEIH